MTHEEALVEAEAMYRGEFGNVPVIAERLSTVTTLTRRKAKKMIEEALVEYLADLMEDYGEES